MLPCRSRFAVLVSLVVGGAACVDVPDSIRAQFAGPGPTESSNYRPGDGEKNTPPAAPAAKASGGDAARGDDDADGGLPVAQDLPAHDGGSS